MIVAIHQPHYLPWLRYIHKVASCDVFVFLDDVQYSKNGWQNRNKIKGPNGPFLLTVPVRDAAFRPIAEVEVDPQISWRQKHWRSILLSYAKAPYFPHWRSVFEEIYATEWTSLVSLNLRVLEVLTRAFGIQTRLVRSSEIDAPGLATERLINLCRRLGGTRYLTGAFAAGNHMDEDAFLRSGIALRVQGWECPRYEQQFPGQGFIPELSAVDLLFNEGPRSLAMLMGEGRVPTPELAVPLPS